MTTRMRHVLYAVIAAITVVMSACDGEGGVGMAAPVGPRARWGGGSSGPGVIVMGGGPVFR